MAIEEKLISLDNLSRYDNNIKEYISQELANVDIGTDTSDATATAADILSPKTAYANGTKLTGTIATKTASNISVSGRTVTVPAGYYASQTTKSISAVTQATPSISVSTGGLITASATQSAGYVASGTKSATKQLTVQAAQTITPSTSDKTIASGRYLTGTQTIKGDANLVAANIKKGVSIFGVSGTHEGGASNAFDLIPTSYTIFRGNADETYGGVTCAKLTFSTNPEIVLPFDATTENTYFYFEHGSLNMNSQIKAIRIPSTGLAGAKLSDVVFLADDSGGYVTYGMSIPLGGSRTVVMAEEPYGWYEISVYVNGKAISLRTYKGNGGDDAPNNFIA